MKFIIAAITISLLAACTTNNFVDPAKLCAMCKPTEKEAKAEVAPIAPITPVVPIRFYHLSTPDTIQSISASNG